MSEFKSCSECHQKKSLDFFYKNKNKDGRFNICKVCHHRRVKIWRGKNRAKLPAYSRTASLRNRYGLSNSEYDQMVSAQNNKCLICGEEPRKTKAFQTWRLHIDHCHKTKKIRGLLCHLCNRGIGLFRERIDLLEKALAYLKCHL